MFVKADTSLEFNKVAEVIDMGHQAEVENIGLPRLPRPCVLRAGWLSHFDCTGTRLRDSAVSSPGMGGKKPAAAGTGIRGGFSSRLLCVAAGGRARAPCRSRTPMRMAPTLTRTVRCAQ